MRTYSPFYCPSHGSLKHITKQSPSRKHGLEKGASQGVDLAPIEDSMGEAPTISRIAAEVQAPPPVAEKQHGLSI